jgi:hypothetical protein
VILILFLVACSSGTRDTPRPAQKGSVTAGDERQLAIRTDGTIDPNRIDLSGVEGVTPAE